MKKGLNVTLMTVAIAVMALQAMAMAPVITDIKSPIVGNEPGATAATPFIFPDAFDINSKATDDTTSSANIRWSYYIAGTAKYRINNVDVVTLDNASINNPAAKRINGATKDPADVDANAATITIRNIRYSPITGSATATASGAGIVDSQVVTLFASDGTTYSSKDVVFYTDDGGNDRFTGQDQTVTPVSVYHPSSWPGSGNTAWTYSILIGTVTSSTATGSGICLDAAATGNNYAGWNSPWGVVPISKNTVYKIRARINGAQTAAGHVPFFDLVIDNYNSTTSTGLNLYGGDFMILDNEGGANAALNKGAMNAAVGTTYTWYWTPAAVNTAQFNASTTLWSTANATARAMEMQFRVLDVNANGGITADADSGAICLNDLIVESFPYSALTFSSPVYNNTALASSGDNWNGTGALGTTVTYSGGVCTMTATSAGQSVEYAQAGPGNGTKDYLNSGTLVDDYPVVWEASTLYQASFKFAAPSSAAEANPWDIYWVGMDAATNEFIAISYITDTVGMCATPKAGTPQEYVAFLYSHNVSATGLGANAKRLRPRCEFGNVATMVDGTNLGGVAISGVTVTKVTAP